MENERRREHFLPLYSDYYFEKKNGTRVTILSICIYAIIMFLMIIAVSKFEFTLAKIWLGIVLAVVFYYVVLHDKVMKRKKVLGILLRPDGAVRENFFGAKRMISYYDLEQEISGGHMKYETTGIRIGKGKNKLLFHYEIGDSKAQKHVEECYKELQTYIHTKLIPYEKKGLDILDKKFVYDKSRKRNTISLCIALLFLWAFVGANGVKNGDTIIACCILVAPWEYFSLYMLAKNAALSKKTYTQLQEFLALHPPINLKVKGEYAGWIRFIVMAVIVIGINCLIILTA